MIENILTRRNCSVKVKLTVKSLLSVAFVAMAVLLPQLVHAAFGAAGGVRWLPMYLPVLLAGCLLGTLWGVGIGVISPFVSFAVTSAWGNPMPVLEKLPFMVVELAVFATVTGAFGKKISQNGWMAFPAVLLAQVAGRATFMLFALMFPSVSMSVATVWAQVQSGLLGMVAQAVLIPFAVMGLKAMLDRGSNDGRTNGKE